MEGVLASFVLLTHCSSASPAREGVENLPIPMGPALSLSLSLFPSSSPSLLCLFSLIRSLLQKKAFILEILERGDFSLAILDQTNLRVGNSCFQNFEGWGGRERGKYLGHCFSKLAAFTDIPGEERGYMFSTTLHEILCFYFCGSLRSNENTLFQDGWMVILCN